MAERVTPRENAARIDNVSVPWICNKGRDLAAIFERPRAERAMGYLEGLSAAAADYEVPAEA
mgnify:CR=1 FL=1